MYAIRMILKYSRVIRWIDGVVLGVFWYLQLFRDEFMNPEKAAHLRLIDFLHFSYSTWTVIFCVLLGGTICEGISGWYKHEILPLMGLPGSLQHRCMSMAAKLQKLIGGFVAENPQPQLPPDNSPQQVWLWEKAFTRRYDSAARTELKALVVELRAENVVCPKCEEVTTLATPNPQQVYATSVQLQEVAGAIAMSKDRSRNGTGVRND